MVHIQPRRNTDHHSLIITYSLATSLDTHRPFLNQNLRVEIGHNLLPVPDIHRPLPLLPLLKFHIVFNEEAAENRLGRVRREVATRTSLTSKPEMQVQFIYRDKALIASLRVLTPSESIEGFGAFDEGWVS